MQELRHAITQSLGSQLQVIMLRLVEGPRRKQVCQMLDKSGGAGWDMGHHGLSTRGSYLANPEDRFRKAQTPYAVMALRDPMMVLLSRSQGPMSGTNFLLTPGT